MPRWAKTILALVGVQLVFLAVVLVPKMREPDGPAARSAGMVEIRSEVEVDLPLPTGRYRTTQGEVGELAAHVGEPFVVHFWGTWCPPCRDELPLLLAREDVEILAVAVDDDSGSLGEYFDGEVPGSVVVSMGLESAFDVERLPVTFWVSAESRIVRRWDGAREWTDADWRAFTAD